MTKSKKNKKMVREKVMKRETRKKVITLIFSESVRKKTI